MKHILSLLTLLLTIALLVGCTSPAVTATVTGTNSAAPGAATTSTVTAAAPTHGTMSSSFPTTPVPATTAAPEPPPAPALDVDAAVAEILTLIGDAETDSTVDSAFVHWICDTFGESVLVNLQTVLRERVYSRDLWYTLTGNSYFVLRDLYTGAAERYGNIRLLSTGKPGEENAVTTLTFGGDICLADNYLTMEYMKKNGKTITECIDPLLVEVMQNDDITFMNNEFTISDRGSPLANKYYTFRAATANTALYNTLGVEIVSLANNHAYDYGKEAFLDTLDALKAHGIEAIGGGKNLDEAMTPVYYIVNGRKIAYVAASRAEKYRLTPEATADSPGILRCYDTAKFLQVIREADANSDFVIACVHWGTEYSDVLQDVQKTTARDYIDAGADLIVGAHAHQLQGIEYYKGKAIFYNLGNFWFNSYEIDTGLLRVELFHDGTTKNTFLPALQKDCVTTAQTGTDKGNSILDWLEAHSVGVTVDSDGTVREKQNAQ